MATLSEVSAHLLSHTGSDEPIVAFHGDRPENAKCQTGFVSKVPPALRRRTWHFTW